MKLFRRISCIALLLMSFSFCAYAMSPTPYTDTKYDNGYRWTWINDDLSVQFETGGPVAAGTRRETLKQKYDYGLLDGWAENGSLKTRDTYAGQWNQAADGTWSFVFDDNTIPIDLTRIDGILYAFNGYGELQDGYDYWNSQKTGPDGVVTCTDPEFLAYLETQYVPECTSHKAEVETEAEGPGH